MIAHDGIAARRAGLFWRIGVRLGKRAVAAEAVHGGLALLVRLAAPLTQQVVHRMRAKHGKRFLLLQQLADPIDRNGKIEILSAGKMEGGNPDQFTRVVEQAPC